MRQLKCQKCNIRWMHNSGGYPPKHCPDCAGETLAAQPLRPIAGSRHARNVGRVTLEFDPCEHPLAVGMVFDSWDFYAMVSAGGFADGTILRDRRGQRYVIQGKAGGNV